MKFPGSSSQMFQMVARNKEINGEPLRKAPGEEREGGLLTSCRVVVVRPLCQRFLRRGSLAKGVWRFARYERRSSLELQLYVYVYPPFRPEASNVVTGSGYVYKNRVDTPSAQFGLIFAPLIAEPSPH